MSKTIRAYYNEFDPKAAAWLRQLIKNGNITQGEVDERSITEVKQSDLQGFDRVHFFSGIGTWDYCLNQAGWGDRPVWTASLPCQPFSAAGKGLGKADERHLLPHFLELVKECKPSRIIGEQVSAAIKHGWLDDLYAEMEANNYAVGSVVIGAHSVGAPHIRQRLYWLANSINHNGQRSIRRINGETRESETSNWPDIIKPRKFSGASTNVCWVADSKIAARERTKQGNHSKSYSGELINRMGVSDSAGSQQRIETAERARHGHSIESAGGDDIQWIYCRDNKYRPIKPSIQPLADGLTKGMVHSSDTGAQINANATQEARTMRLKGYGNAIQAQTAIAFINAFLDVIGY